MANTATSDIFDVFMQQVTDYRLVTLMNASIIDFENFLEAWLVLSISEFDVCTQSLVFDTTTKLFTVVLTQDNINVLATLMLKHWMIKNVNDITQMNLHVGDRDFKVPSEANNLKEKQSQLNVMRETCSQMLINYSYKGNDWARWFNQDFSGM